MKTFEQAFWEKVNRDGPIPVHLPYLDKCWIWEGNRTGNNYGQVKWTPRDRNRMLSHRASWLIHYGEIPKLNVLHKCDNTLCVNPHHLWLGTQKDNIQDCKQKGRINPVGGRNQKGEGNYHAKLTQADVLEIRRKFASGKYTQIKLAIEFRVTQPNIGYIVRRESWI